MTLARWASRVLVGSRRWFGGDARTIVRRRGIQWSLDLSEAIELSIYLLGTFERSVTLACERLVSPGSIVLDVGANIGAQTLPLARRVGPKGRVIAIEATEYAFGRLVNNLALNPNLQKQVHLVHALLVADTMAEYADTAFSRWPLGSESKGHPRHGGVATRAGRAEVTTLDSIVDDLEIETVDLVKLDTDGSEFEVLSGGQQFLARQQPVILMEMAPYAFSRPGPSFADVIELLTSHGYRFVKLDGVSRLPSDGNGIARRIRDGAAINALAIPKNRWNERV